MMIDCSPHSIQTMRSGRVGHFFCASISRIYGGIVHRHVFHLARDDLLDSLAGDTVEFREDSRGLGVFATESIVINDQLAVSFGLNFRDELLDEVNVMLLLDNFIYWESRILYFYVGMTLIREVIQ